MAHLAKGFFIAGGIYVERNLVINSEAPTSLSGRGAVVGFSAGAAVRMRRYLRCCVSAYTTMLTLTYPREYPCDGRTVKEHLRRFLQELRRYADKQDLASFCRSKLDGTTELRQQFSAFWFLEFQKRGAPHFHIFCTHSYHYQWVAELWYRIVNSGDEKHLRAGTRIEAIHTGRAGTISYASKYAAKAEQKDVPEIFLNVGRFWGVCGNRDVVAASTTISHDRLSDERISRCVKRLHGAVKEAIDSGKAEIFKKEQGLRIVIFKKPEYSDKALQFHEELSRLNAELSEDYMNIFTDAEVS